MASSGCSSLPRLLAWCGPQRSTRSPFPALLSAGSFASTSRSASTSSLPPVYVSHIPHKVPYGLGLALQEAIYNLRGSPEVLLLLEHTPVYTEGRRGPQGEEDETEDERQGHRLQAVGADYHVTRRGGLITYHGPGQLVGYPILHLGRMELSNRCYVDRLQSSLASFLRSHYILPTVPPPDDNTGVWSTPSLKIVSIGVQVRHRITSHGFALNVTNDVLPWFKRIVACGIKGKGMTCMQTEMARRIKEEEEDQTRDGDASELQTERSDEAHLETSRGPGHTAMEREKPIALGPEPKMLTVQSVAPHVAEALGKTFNRELVQAGEELLRYEADEKGVLARCWLQGKEVAL